ncbi:MAG: MobA/MobL family protein [Gammaproteobacteria bacterium]|nr:MobA/MobL family protein [Gammaproteobacteria bacterium]
MAIFRMQISSVSRSSGRKATAAAAYRAGERIRDERTSEQHNYSRRRDVVHTEIFLPAQVAGASAAWARNREQLWNMAEHSEKRHSARVAREYELSLPSELTAAQRVGLARAFSRDIAERYKVAVDLAVHDPRPGGDPRNFHAHLLTTTREVTPTGLGAKAGIDMRPLERRRRGLPDHRHEYLSLRERWANLTNTALREANIAARVDHRSLAAQGIDREPLPRIPLAHLKMEQRGVRSELADRLRADYRSRVQARLQRSATPDQFASAGKAPTARSAAVARIPDLEEVRRQAREAWLRLRANEAGKPGEQFRGPAKDAERTANDRSAVESEQQLPDDFAL